MLLRLAQMVLCVVSFVIFAFAQSQNYLPLTAKELGPSIHLKQLGRIKDGQRVKSSVGPAGATYRTTPDGLVVLDGTDKDGKLWAVDTLTIGCDSPRIYESDLDKDGVIDAVLVRNTCSNGLAPSSHIMTVTFDQAGRPIPFEAEGYFKEEAGGVDALVDVDRDGRSELIYMNLDENYWITNVYTIAGGRWSKVKGRFANHEFPLFTRFTKLPNKTAVKPSSKESPFAPDLSNNSPIISGQLVAYSWQDQYSVQLTIITAPGEQTKCTPNYWYQSARVVVDLPSGRRIRRLSYQEPFRTEGILNEIVRGKYQVEVYGERYRDKCGPELIWASTN